MNLYLYQPQYTFSYNNHKVFWFPYSIGCLWTFAQQYEDVKQTWVLKELGFQREDIATVVNRMVDPDLVGLSVYIWNRNYCIALGQAIKKRWPNCIIEVGGPMVNGGWSKYSWVDTIILGEGERAFIEVLRTVAKKQTPDLFYKAERMHSLSSVPSPYTSGLFDNLVNANPDYYWNVTIETNRGCPYQCTFCDWGGLTASKIKLFDLQRIKEELEWIAKQKISSIYIADSNLGIFFERDKKIARMIRQVADQLGIDYVSSNFLKNSDERLLEIADILGETSKGLTYSVQSMNPETLKIIKRHNIKPTSAKKLFELSTKRNIEFYTELMLGLPMETKETWMKGMTDLLEMGQHNRIIIIPVVLLENTELGDIQKDLYGIKTIEVVDGFRLTDNENNGVEETWPWVCSTSTMSKQDIIDSTMYGWMISNFHTLGKHSFILSKYCRHVLGISYQEFYREMWDRLNDDVDSVVHQQFKITKKAVEEIYTNGYTTSKDLGPDNLTTFSSGVLQEAFDQTHDFCMKVTEKFGNIEIGIIEIQRRFMFNNYFQVPYKIDCLVDIESWKTERCTYKIEPHVNPEIYNHNLGHRLYYKKILNQITRIDNQ